MDQKLDQKSIQNKKQTKNVAATQEQARSFVIISLKNRMFLVYSRFFNKLQLKRMTTVHFGHVLILLAAQIFNLA